jgi:hypothetical protein
MANPKGNGSRQSDEVLGLIREGTALQIEMLGAAARVWSEIVERVASYNRELTNELMEFTAGNREAGQSLERLVDEGKRHVRELTDLPKNISSDFKKRVKKRAGHPVE